MKSQLSRFTACCLVCATLVGCGERIADAPSADARTDVARQEPQAAPQADAPEAELLSIGSAAPPIASLAFLKGDPVHAFASDQVYVIEFWATWCGPCRTSMPHLSDLQEQYGKAIKVIGISDENEDTVQGFLATDGPNEIPWQDTVTYRLALDDGQVVTRAYLEGAGKTGIPVAFIVGRDGAIEWIGHPMTMDEPLRQVVDGDWDRTAAREAYDAAARRQQVVRLASQAIRRSMISGDWDTSLTTIEELLEQFPDDVRLGSFKSQILQLAGRDEELLQWQATQVERAWDEPQLLNGLAWTIAIGEEPRDLQLALRAAIRATDMTNETDGSILDTLARVHYELGDLETAIAWQEKAVAVAPNTRSITETYEQFAQELAARNAAASDGESQAQGEAPAVSETTAADEEQSPTSQPESE